jgi:hypothetical protein
MRGRRRLEVGRCPHLLRQRHCRWLGVGQTSLPGPWAATPQAVSSICTASKAATGRKSVFCMASPVDECRLLRPSRPGGVNARTPWWQKLYESTGGSRHMPWNAAFATVAVATLATLLWHDREVPDARIAAIESTATGFSPATPRRLCTWCCRAERCRHRSPDTARATLGLVRSDRPCVTRSDWRGAFAGACRIARGTRAGATQARGTRDRRCAAAVDAGERTGALCHPRSRAAAGLARRDRAVSALTALTIDS